MAITNAQQYQQLVNKPANSKRPGYRGQGSKETKDNRQSYNAAQAAANVGKASTAKRDKGDYRGSTDYITSVTGDEFKKSQRDFKLGVDGAFNPIVGPTGPMMPYQKFQTKRPKSKLSLGLFDILSGGKLGQAGMNFLASKNRPFFINEVVRAGKIPGLNFATIKNMTNEELEEAYQQYDRDRLAGKIDAYGNPIVTYGKDQGDYSDSGLISMLPVVDEPETTEPEPEQLLTSRILGTQFAADGGRAGYRVGGASGREYDQGYGPNNKTTDTSMTTSGGDESKGPPSVINPPKTEPIVERLKKRNLPGDSLFKKFLAHDKFVDQLKARRGKNYHELGGLDFMARFPNMNPEVAKMLASGYQNVFELGRAIADGPGGKTIGDALDTAKEEARLNAVGIDAFSDPTSSLYQKYAGMVPESGAVQMAGGGIASLDREAFLLGGLAKGLKKAVRGVKKLVKSPIGKAALLGAGMFGIPGTSFGGLLGRASFGGAAQGMFGSFGPVSALKKLGIMKTQMEPGLFERIGPLSKLNLPMAGIFGVSALAGLTAKEDKGDDELAKYYAQSLNPSLSIRGMGSDFDFDFYGARTQAVADGGRIGYQEGSKEPVAKKTLPLIDMDGMEKDYRETGGFVEMGRMEKADDVPARLSKNEFVFTADAVRNAGDGDIDKGAEVMYNMMKNLEAGGEVSEESQGLEGAREMFQTSQRLGEVI